MKEVGHEKSKVGSGEVWPCPTLVFLHMSYSGPTCLKSPLHGKPLRACAGPSLSFFQRLVEGLANYRV